MKLVATLKNQWENHPLRSILLIAFLVRFVAAIFSQGYGMHDDHFIAIEEPWSWTQGMDYDGWLPGTKGEASEPSIYSFFYPGINYLLFEGMHAIGIENPKIKMFFIRLLLALFSLLVVYYGYKITEYYSDQKNARQVGVLLSILWFMPFFFGVRNLVEVIAIPTLLASTWMILKSNYLERKDKLLPGLFFSGWFYSRHNHFYSVSGHYLLGRNGTCLINTKKVAADNYFWLRRGVCIYNYSGPNRLYNLG
jgi:hypothetical protein